ncbi:MAG: 30S ribosomal protein S15 [Bacilli bacterium]|nr:30S ribosomal protein S15 [Bacilli bacterium]
MALSKEEKNLAVQKFGKGEKDTGNTSVQVALLTKRIEDLTEHLKKNHKDARASRALLELVGKRKRLLKYIAKKDPEGYASLILALGLRK